MCLFYDPKRRKETNLGWCKEISKKELYLNMQLIKALRNGACGSVSPEKSTGAIPYGFKVGK